MSPSSSAVATAATAAATAGARARVLAVDDGANVLAALRRSLRARGYEVASAEGGAQALEMMGAQAFDAIVSDMRMPGMNGAEFLQAACALQPRAVRLRLRAQRDRLLMQVDQHNAQLQALNQAQEVRVAERTVALRQALERSDLAHQQIKQGFTATMHMLGPALGLAGAALQDAIFAAMLVDLGKLLLPERLLQQPCSELVGEDRRQWLAHPQHAHALLLGNPALQGVAELDKALIGQLQRFQTRSETMLSLTVYAPEPEPTVPS